MPYECDILENRISYGIVGAGIEIHKRLGPGLLESAYGECLAHELATRGFIVARDVRIPLTDKDLRVEGAFRADLVIDEKVLIEVKAVAAVLLVVTSDTLAFTYPLPPFKSRIGRSPIR